MGKEADGSERRPGPADGGFSLKNPRVAGAQPQQWADGPQHKHRVIACWQQPAARVPGDSRSCSREPMRLRNAGEATPARGAGESRGTGEERQTAGAATPSRAVWLGKKTTRYVMTTMAARQMVSIPSIPGWTRPQRVPCHGCVLGQSLRVPSTWWSSAARLRPVGIAKASGAWTEERVRGTTPDALSARAAQVAPAAGRWSPAADEKAKKEGHGIP